MKSNLTGKAVWVWFGVVLILYGVVFQGIEYWRHKEGPWVVDFLADARGQPSLLVQEKRLGIANLRITFAEETAPQSALTNLPQRVIFDAPLKAIPFGKRLHEDLTALPGVETFDMFGHFVELAPKVLTLNQERRPWLSNTNLVLQPTNKPTHPLQPRMVTE